MNLEEFTLNFIEDIRNESQIQSDTPSNVFLNKMVEKLEEIAVLFNSNIYPFSRPGQKNKIMRIDGFSFDDADKSLIIFLNDYLDSDTPPNLTQTQINELASRMIQFVVEVASGSIFNFIDDSLIDFKNFLKSVHKRFQVDYISEVDEPIDKVKLIILTNKKLTNRKLNVSIPELEDKSVELNIWDIERIYELVKSGREREPLEVDFTKYNLINGIPFIKADFKNNDLYDAFLCIIPGQALSEIYYEHGSRLLEGNIRTFLSIRGKINKNIRATIKNEPSKFFAYNNGISCTAKSVELSADGTSIIKIGDLQIINGGQTTASLTSANKKDKSNLDLIYVPMKLTLVKDQTEEAIEQGKNNYETMIQNIARFANSQNKIKDSDFFSNHPFHRQMELLSKQNHANPKTGQFYSSYWFYERSRGSYEQLQFKLKNQSEKNDFLKKYPKDQVLKKEELAKYMMAGKYLRPDIVSKGSEKNMVEFASLIEELWTNSSATINDYFFKEAVGYALLYKTVDKLVSKSSWYYSGGPKLNIVPYTISKFIHSLPKGSNLDLLKIWEKQDLSLMLQNELVGIAEKTFKFISDSNGTLITEYAKKLDTWQKYKNIPLSLSVNINDDLVSDPDLNARKHIAIKEKKELNGLELEMKIIELSKSENGQYWQRLLMESKKRRMWTPKLESIFLIVSELGKISPTKYPTSPQLTLAWSFRNELEKQGVLV
jgi:hypothetical protein